MKTFRLGLFWLLAALAPLCSFGLAHAQGATQPVRNEYVLGSGDVIRVTVYQNPDLTLETRVSEAGVISYPLLGSVKVGGQSVTEVEKRIADGLKTGNFVKQPQVTVLVVQVRGNQVSVLGQVNRPGRYPLEVADSKLSDVLAVAGGVAPTGADVVTVVGVRGGQPFRAEIDLARSIGSANRSTGDIQIVNGDVVWVDRAPTVYIYGEVQRAGAIRLERGMTVMQALATGGGLTVRGTEKGMRVHRRGTDGKVQVLQPSMDDQLRDGDVVYVRESLF
ncbi:polysaccharide export protein EpsE [Methylibium petroleiphilum]|uniref:Capsular polysaccharide export protein, putative n=1 Tax=Methylibium petroleiphilum (strain ATCC BAA-1232 / LMG 22953 / PM1) TaxID=420662 RepID=A2SJE9_METPP|nr:polysaccharide export protein EpsE [Methylibium petroleiphilum]ABM95688.1 capsular polysaccharide export protein, putative [Methylibium petroleiphilum PM1]